MPVVAVVNLDEIDDDCIIGAFVGDECRGIGHSVGNEGRIHVSVTGQRGDIVTFRLFDKATGNNLIWFDRESADKDAPLFPAFAQAYRTAEQKLNLANKAIFKLAEVEDSRIKGRATWHSFRATFITRLTEAGCPVSIVKELAQHTKGDVTQRYVHISMENKLRWLSAIPELGEVDLEAEYPTEPELPQAAGADAAS